MILNVESLAELNGKNWEYTCDKEKNCIIGIRTFIQDKDTNKAKSLATVYIQIQTSTQKKLNLLDEKDQTYKMGEEKVNVPIIFVLLPLNSELRVKPIIRVGGKDISGLNFSHCNLTLGCNALLNINDEVIKLFEKEKEMSVIFRAHGAEKNVEFKFSLKDFTKKYKQLIKS